MKSVSKKVFLAIVAAQFLMVFAVHDFRDREHHFLTWDAYGYYLYLPGAFIFHDLDCFQFVENQHVAHFISGTPYQIRTLPDGHRAPSYTMGLAILWLPFFLIAHIFSLALGFPADGLTLPYQLAIGTASVFYCAVGFWFLRKLLRCFFSEKSTTLTLATLFFGTNLFYFYAQNPGLTHGYLFSAFAVLLWLTTIFFEKPTLKIALALAATLALMCLIRPATSLAALLPIFYGVIEKQNRTVIFLNKRYIFLAILLAVALLFPQMWIWKISSGQWIFNGYAAAGWGFDWQRPDWLHKIFSFEKGWLVYSPALGFGLIGFLFLQKRAAAWLPASLVFFVVNAYVVFCYNQWPFDSSFGFRGLVECYPVLALPMAAFFEKMSARRGIFCFILLIIGALISLNLFQTWQTERRILRLGPNPKAFYEQVFLKAKRDPLDLRFLDLKERKPSWKNGPLDSLASLEFLTTDTISEKKDNFFSEKIGGGKEFSRPVEFVFDEKTAARLAGKWLTLRGQFFQNDDSKNCAVLVFEIARPDSSKPLKWVGVHLQSCILKQKWANFEFDATAPTDLRAGDRARGYLWSPSCADSIWVAGLRLFSEK